MPRARTPTAKRALENNPANRPMPDNEPQYAGVADPPGYLSDEALAELGDGDRDRERKALMVAGRAEWKRVINMLAAVGLATQGEQSTLGLYIDAWMRWTEATNGVKALGMIVKAPSGFPVQNPYLPIINKSWDQMLKVLKELGLTPAAKAGVEAGVPQLPKTKADGEAPSAPVSTWDLIEGAGGAIVPVECEIIIMGGKRRGQPCGRSFPCSYNAHREAVNG